MILNLIQKNELLRKTKEMLENFGENQKESSFKKTIDSCRVYEVETDGKIVIFYDLKDPDVFVFDSFEEFKQFVMKEL